MGGNHLLHFFAVGEDGFHGDAVAAPHFLRHLVGLFMETPGIQGKDPESPAGRASVSPMNLTGDPRGHIHHHQVFFLEAAGNGEILAVRLDRPREKSFRGVILQVAIVRQFSSIAERLIAFSDPLPASDEWKQNAESPSVCDSRWHP